MKPANRRGHRQPTGACRVGVVQVRSGVVAADAGSASLSLRILSISSDVPVIGNRRATMSIPYRR